MNVKSVQEAIRKHNIRWIQLQFADLLGRMRVVHIRSETFLDDEIWCNGIGFDGSSVGFATVDKSDMIAMPDSSTYLVLPHEEGEARIIANIYTTSLKPYIADPRHILKKAILLARQKGFDEVMIGPEMEFYVLDGRQDGHPAINENKGYFVPSPLDNAKDYRKVLAEMLVQSGYQIKYHHHETGKYQHEIELSNLHALSAADFCLYFKYIARDLAPVYDLRVTFMPKPFSNDAGSGMHAHISLYKNAVNTFYDENDKYNLSQTALYFIGGILEHARGLAAIANPIVTSYKRLIPHFEAPIYIAWARHNRSSLIRIPAKKNAEVEIRNADPSANPYFFYAALIHAGLDGIKKKIEYAPVEQNLYQMDSETLKKFGILQLPTSLLEALHELEEDTVIKKAIGSEASELFIERKKREWNEYMTEVTDADYMFYFNC